MKREGPRIWTALPAPQQIRPKSDRLLVAAVIDRDKLYQVVGLDNASASLDLAIRGEDIPDRLSNRVFYDDAALFSRDVVRTTVNLPSGRWGIGARARAGWLAETVPALWLLRLGALTLAAVLVALLQSRSRHLERQARALEALQRSAQALRRSQQDLINAIEALAEGFALWDQDDRLQVYNQRLLSILPALVGSIRIGMSFESLLRAMADIGVVAVNEDREAWIARRLEQHRRPGGAFEVRTSAGRVTSISEYQTADGDVVGLYTDITDMRNAQEHSHYRAYFDPLTELPKRKNFMNQLAADHQSVAARRSPVRLAVHRP